MGKKQGTGQVEDNICLQQQSAMCALLLLRVILLALSLCHSASVPGGCLDQFYQAHGPIWTSNIQCKGNGLSSSLTTPFTRHTTVSRYNLDTATECLIRPFLFLCSS